MRTTVRFVAARYLARPPELDDMLAQAVDIDEAAARRMRALDQPRADEGDDGAGGENFGDSRQRVVHSEFEMRSARP